MLIIMAGLPGTGKSTVARAVAARVNGHVLDKDVVRQALFGPDRIDFSTEQDSLVVDLMLGAAAFLFARDPKLHVIVDGRVFWRNEQLRRVTQAAQASGQRWMVVECACPENVALSRLQRDHETRAHVAGNRTPELYRDLRTRFEPIPQPKTVVDTSAPIEECVEKVLQAVAAAGASSRDSHAS